MKPLVIENFQKGTAPSVHVGFGQIRNMDLNTFPGIARINNLLEKQSEDIVIDLPLWFVLDPADGGDVYALGDEGYVYKSTNSGSTWTVVTGNTRTTGAGQGLAVWKDYLFVARRALLDVYGPLSGSPSWTNGWKSLTSDSRYHPMLVGQDDILYVGAGRYVTSLEESTTFDPSDSSSYVYTSDKLTLPSHYKVKCLAELGLNLMVGTWMGSNPGDFKVADIFPWDRNAETAGLPVRLAENSVNAMLTVDNVVYVSAGMSGKLFVTNGTSVALVAQIPEDIATIEGGGSLIVYPGGMIRHKGKVYFGVGSNSETYAAGVWSFTPGKENGLALENIISTGHDGSITGNPVKVGGLLSIGREIYLAGWKDAGAYGIDMINQVKRYTGYTAFIESPLYSVGTVLAKRTFSTIEVQLVKPLVSDQGIRVRYRKNLTDDYSDPIFTFDEATMGGKLSHSTDVRIADAEFVQFKIELTTVTNNNNTSPELRRITLP